MSLKHYIIIAFITLSVCLKAQTFKQSLIQANALTFHQKIYAYGYEQSKSNLLFKCYAYNYQLKLQDSILFDLGKSFNSRLSRN